MEFIRERNRIYSKDDSGELVAEVTFPDVTDNTVAIDHTFVSPALRGGGLASLLLETAYDEIKRQGKKAYARCRYAVSWFAKHADKRDILAD